MVFKELSQKLTSSLDFFVSELTKIRTGRASTALVEDMEIDAYGSKMRMKELGSISTPEPQVILIAPWDRSLLKEIEKALRQSSLGVNPVVGGDSIKVPVPPLTEERRKEMVKGIGFKLEECKTSMRNVRQEAMKDIDRTFAEKQIGEDEKFSRRDEVEDTVKDFMQRAEDAGNNKIEEILKI